MSAVLSKVEDAIAAIAAGKVVIVVDDEDRENEGDFIAAAEKCSPEMAAFMITEGRGQLCLPIAPEIAERLDLNAAVARNNAPHRTPFLEAIDHVATHTGISAAERSRTIRAAADPSSKAADFVRPGHVSPLLAKEGGVLRRAGHTEAAVDLARMAGLAPAGVLIEILDGTGVATRQKLHEIADRFELPIVSIEALIRFRRSRERLVHRVVETNLPTRYGPARVLGFSVDHEPSNEPMVVVMGDLQSIEAPLVRLHSSCYTGDVLASLRCDCGDQLDMALRRIADEGVGALVLLPQEGRGIGLLQKLRAYQLQDQGLDTVDANLALGFRADMRDYGIGLQILRDLGLSKVRLLTNNPKKVDAFVIHGHGLTVVDQVPLVAPEHADRRDYMNAKRDRMGHLLPIDLVN